MKNVNVEVGLARLEKLVQSPGSHIEIKQQPVVLRQGRRLNCLVLNDCIEKLGVSDFKETLTSLLVKQFLQKKPFIYQV